jgi:two-component system OmpR family sensor kinase
MSLRQSNFNFKKDGYSYEFTTKNITRMKLPQNIGSFYVKVFYQKIMVKIDEKIIHNEIKKIILFTISIQTLLIICFAFISWILAKKSLKPMVEALSYLDSFTKDLIHDLNTPISAILVNVKILKNNASNETIKKIERIEKSAKNIISLYDNLDILLDENNLLKEKFNLSNIIYETIKTYESIYPQIKFNFDNKDIFISSNSNALKRIIDNILSNSCKYSNDTNPTINISYQNSTLIIQDNGKGIKYPKKIFQRSYKENDGGHGIGMHIVHRLCSELNILIEIDSNKLTGTRIALTL